MKFFAFVLLFAVATSQVAAPQSSEQMEIIKCIIDNSGFLSQDAVELIEAIKEKDYVKAIAIVSKLYEQGKDLYQTCFKNDQLLGYNWPAFGKCILREGAKKLAKLQPLVDEIMAKNWEKVAELVADIAFRAIPTVVKCYGEGKETQTEETTA